MIKKLAILSCLVVSAWCMTLHQPQYPVHNPNYRFSYEVHDTHTGDIKSQQETRRGDSVTGQYALIQPDGVRRTVDYRADDLRGFRASVNNYGRPVYPNFNEGDNQGGISNEVGSAYSNYNVADYLRGYQASSIERRPVYPNFNGESDNVEGRSNTVGQVPSAVPQWPVQNAQNATPRPVATSRVSVYQQSISSGHNAWN